MKRLFSAVPISMLLIASVVAGKIPALAQGETKTIVFNLEVLEFSTDLAKEIERLAQDRGRMDRLTAEGKVRPVGEIQVRTRPGESSSVIQGQRIPIQMPTGQGSSQIQYENTGLNLDITPGLTADSRITASLKIAFTSVSRLAPGSTFAQRTFSTRVNMKPNERVILLSVVQQGTLWPSLPNATPSDSAYGNYLLLLTAKILD